MGGEVALIQDYPADSPNLINLQTRKQYNYTIPIFLLSYEVG